ncbi:YdeI family protein [Planctomycetota bacterium]
MEQVYVKTRTAWRNWLRKNQKKNTGIWLVFYKKHTGKPSLDYNDAVEEALCFGWIDSIIKKIDDERYVRKFTPRKATSRWSESNKKRVTKLIKQGLMTPSGLALIKQAKKAGLWAQADRPHIPEEMPRELQLALAKNKKAKRFFDQLVPTYQKHFIGWVAMAKRPDTKARRVHESITLLEQGKKLGLK